MQNSQSLRTKSIDADICGLFEELLWLLVLEVWYDVVHFDPAVIIQKLKYINVKLKMLCV